MAAVCDDCAQIPGEDTVARARTIVDRFLAVGLAKLQDGSDSGAADLRVGLALLASIVRGADAIFPAREADVLGRTLSQVATLDQHTGTAL